MNGTSGCCSTWTTAACPPWTKTATSCRCSSPRPRTVTPPSTCSPRVAGCRRPRSPPRTSPTKAGPRGRRPTCRRSALAGSSSPRPGTCRLQARRRTCWSSKSNPRPDSGPDTTRPRGSACGRCRTSICVAHACSTSAPAPACWPSPPYAWAQPRHSASTTTPMRSSRPRTRCAATGWRREAAVRMELRGLDDQALLPSDVVCANLTGALLRQQGARVQALLVPGGRAVLSGFTEDEARWVRDAFDACDVEATLRRRVLGRLRVATARGHVPGVAHHRQRGQRHLLGPHRHRRQRPRFPPGVASPPPLLQPSIRLRGRSPGTGLVRARARRRCLPPMPPAP